MHAIVVPIKDGRLQADAIRGYKQVSKQRNHALYGFLKGDYGLDYPERLKGVRKAIGADLAIDAIHQLSPESLLGRIRLELEAAIYSRPEPFLSALGISYQEIQSEVDWREEARRQIEHDIRQTEIAKAWANGEGESPF
jgi:hypothetical protein